MTTPTQEAQRLGDAIKAELLHPATYRGTAAVLATMIDRLVALVGAQTTGPCAGCDIPNGCPEYCYCGGKPAEPLAQHHITEDDDAALKRALKRHVSVVIPAPREVQPLTDEQIEAARHQTFSTSNPFCPCDSKTMRKAVRWAERACATAWGVKLAGQTKEPSHGN